MSFGKYHTVWMYWRSRHFFLDMGAVCTLAILLPISLVYEIVEQNSQPESSRQLLDVLYVARGIGASVFIILLASRFILRWCSPRHTSVAIDEKLDQDGIASPGRSQAYYTEWFIRMRWIAIIVAGVCIITAVRIVPLLPEEVLWPLLLTLFVLIASNLIYAAVTPVRVSAGTNLQLQIYLDLVILIVFLHYSGGVENPLAMVMLLHVIIGGIILAKWQCYMVAGASSVLLSLLAYLEGSGSIAHYTLSVFPHTDDGEAVHHAALEPLYVTVRVGLQSLLLFLAAYFVTTVSDRLRQHERRLRRMADAALAQNQLLERSLETTGAALRVLDTDLRLQWENARWRSWFGRCGDERSEAMVQLDGPKSAASQTVLDGLARETELGVTEFKQDALDLLGDDVRCYHVTTACLRDAEGRVDRVVELAQDTTGQKRAQAQLIRAGQLAAVGELAGQVAHEVNNPIAIIGAKSRLLLSDHRHDMSDEVASELGKIIRLSDRVARIAQGLLSYCRPSGAVRVDMDVRTPVRSALAMIEQRAENAGIRIVIGMDREIPSVHANEQELEQVFLNILLNALDAISHCEGTLSVSVRYKRSPDDRPAQVHVEIADSGDGIPAEIQGRIFRPFFTTKSKGRGTGLGLSICQGIVTSHGGRISLVSKEAVGTTVTVSFPVSSKGI